MQNSELYRRGFVVPLSKEAEYALMADDVTYNTNVEFYELPDQETFEELCSLEIFDRINSNLGALLSDYEEDIINETQVHILKELVIRFEDLPYISLKARDATDGLMRLCNTALRHKRPIFFIL